MNITFGTTEMQDNESQNALKEAWYKILEYLDFTTVKIAEVKLDWEEEPFILERRHQGYYSCNMKFKSCILCTFETTSYKVAIRKMKQLYGKYCTIKWNFTTLEAIDNEQNRLIALCENNHKRGEE